MIRVPGNAPPGSFVLATFTTHHPTTGNSVNADSTPTGILRRAEPPFTVAGAVTITNVSTGVYVVTMDSSGMPFHNYYEPWQHAMLVVTATVGGVTQRRSWLVCSMPTVYGGEISSAAAAPTYDVDLYYPNDSTTISSALSSGALYGSLLSTVTHQEVKRITNYVFTGGVHRITLESSLANPLDKFWIITV